MPCYNAGKYINKAIESVLAQSYTDWELIIVDDGSTDQSLNIAKSFCDNRIAVKSQENAGACVARNKGIDLAHGEYIKFLDADDVLDADCLKNQIEQIASLKDNQIPFGDYDNIDEDGNVISDFTFSDKQKMLQILKDNQPYFFFCYWQILISSPLYRRKDILKIEGFDISFKRGQESDLHFRLSLSGVEFVYCKSMTFSYREYTSIDRITSKGRNNKTFISEYWLQRTIKYERLLCEKYGTMPIEYKPSFAKYWFNRARGEFSVKNIKEGNYALMKAHQFGFTTRFMKFYHKVGHVVGYSRLESIFRLRLKLIGKK